ncbi:MAG: hypothetical protein M9907_10760 [Burkholderiaceae bacterium]|nr:hypothetical protein [Burkholderiaceae bacterium]
MQESIVAVLVVACGIYAVWTFMPTSARNWLRRVVLRRPPQVADGCGACGGCATPHEPSRDAESEHVVRVVRR